MGSSICAPSTSQDPDCIPSYSLCLNYVLLGSPYGILFDPNLKFVRDSFFPNSISILQFRKIHPFIKMNPSSSQIFMVVALPYTPNSSSPLDLCFDAINTSGSRNRMIDDVKKKMKRMQSNRESARRSRMRKQKRFENLTREVRELQIVNSRIVESVNGREEAMVEIESMNNFLRVEAIEMTCRLRALDLMLQIQDDANVVVVDVRDPWLEPWQLNQQSQPPPPLMAAYYDMFLV
uniref:BZIP domain-containing protein n=1 Tax=Cucumis sativus TaxID=3659 RepID=A0A0A0K6D0_CUCSA